MSEIDSSFDRLAHEATDQATVEGLAFCQRAAYCSRRAGHLGVCTPEPHPHAIAFDADRKGEAERHVQAMVVTMPPEHRPERYRHLPHSNPAFGSKGQAIG